MKKTENYGFEVVYADTEGFFGTLENEIKKF